jgi:hypothetical protein
MKHDPPSRFERRWSGLPDPPSKVQIRGKRVARSSCAEEFKKTKEENKMKFSKVQLIYRRKRTQPRNRQLPQVVGRAFSSASSQHGRAQWRRSSAHPAAAGSTSAAARSGAGDGAVAGAAPRADSHLRHARFDPR